MRATILRFEGPYAICMKEDCSIVDIKRINIPMEAEEGDVLNIDGYFAPIKKQETKGMYFHIDNIMLDS